MSTMGRQRSARFRDLPPNLIADVRRGMVYYRYKMPDGKREPMGKDKKAAIAAANSLNQHFNQQADNLVDRVFAPPKPSFRNPLLTTLIEAYKPHLRSLKLAEGTIKGKEIKLREYAAQWPKKTVQAFQTIDISRFLADKPYHAYGKHRVLLCDLFQFACHEGYITDNPALRTLEKKEKKPNKIRQRHTWAGYCATYEAAEPWLQRAMALGLYSVQRRQDIVVAHRDKVDIERGTFRVYQQKSANYRNPVYIEIEMGRELRTVVEQCIASDVPCPYLVHRRPDRIQARDRAAKLHPFAVTLDYLSKAFSAARDTAGAYDHMPMVERPTFHELRAFGIHLYLENGYDKPYVGALSGHADERMVDHYAKDHEDKKPVLVKAGLSLKGGH